MYVRVCKVCGKKFETPEYRIQLCSDECRRVSERRSYLKQLETDKEYRLRKKREKKEKERRERAEMLGDLVRQAREHGMSYGQYMVYLKERA